MRLEIGAGEGEREGWILSDIQYRRNLNVVFDARRPFPFRPETFDHILMWGVFEHFGYNEALRVLDNCRDALCVGGLLEFSTPDLAAVCAIALGLHERVSDEVVDKYRGASRRDKARMYALGCLYGGQDNEFMYHKWGWTVEDITDALEERLLIVEKIDKKSAYEPGTHLHVFARKEAA